MQESRRMVGGNQSAGADGFGQRTMATMVVAVLAFLIARHRRSQQRTLMALCQCLLRHSILFADLVAFAILSPRTFSVENLGSS